MESPERQPQKQKQIHDDDGNNGGAAPSLQIAQGKGSKDGRRRRKKARLLDFLRAAPTKGAFLSRVATLRTRAATMHAALPAAFACFLRAPAFVRTVDWRALRARCVVWARHPMNVALLVWLAFVAAGVAVVFLLMVGALDSAVPEESRRKRWTEVANQMLNALFTIMCVYQHPQLCHHLMLLVRWRASSDVAELRSVYCKNLVAAGPVRRERLHLAVVVLLLHATCFAQYAYCALFWCFSSDARPDWAVNLLMGLGLGTPIAAGLYLVYGPLGRKTALAAAPSDEEAAAVQQEEDEVPTRRVVVSKPEWAGGLFDLADDPTVSALSLSCTFCVFGWNMERLGMGNMYVHAITFGLLCAAPVLVFAAAALNIRNPTLGYLVVAAGALLSVLGLTYGGFWRGRMRKRFGLPADDDKLACVPSAAAADYGRWLLCAPCALAQEVRTGNFYDVEGDGLYARDEECGVEEGKPAMAPLEREGCLAELMAAEMAGERVSVAVVAPPVPVMDQKRIGRIVLRSVDSSFVHIQRDLNEFV